MDLNMAEKADRSFARCSCKTDGCLQRGSFLVAGALFLLLFFGVATLAVDMSSYFSRSMQLQNIADGAARAGAQAFDQRMNEPSVQKIHDRILRYIRVHQGEQYADLYVRHGNNYVEGIEIDARHSPELARKAQCIPEFDLSSGSLEFSEPATLETKFLGSAITDGDGNRFPVTTRLRVTDRDGNTSDSEPWGPYDDKDRGNVNTGEYFPPFHVNPKDEKATVDVWGQSWEPDGDHYIEVSTKQSHPESDQTRLLRDGEPLPNVGGGAHDQEDVSYFLQEYVDDNGHLDLAENQMIVLFELGTKGDFSTDAAARDNDVADFQDLALLVSVNKPSPENGGNGGGGKSITPNGTMTKAACAGYYYRIGVTAYGDYEPVFLPKAIFGNEPRAMFSSAVAEARPRFHEGKEPARLQPTGVISGSLPYTYRDPTTVNVEDYYGVKNGSSSGCDMSYDFIDCDDMSQLISNLGNNIHLKNQVLFLRNNFLEVDPSESGAIHSLTGSGYVIVAKNGGDAILIDQDGNKPGVVYGNLDLVALNGNIKFDEFDGNVTFKAYFMAPNNRIHQGSRIRNVSLDIIGGYYSHHPVGGGDATINVIPDRFCPTNENSKLCREVSVIEPGSTPYTWEVSLTD